MKESHSPHKKKEEEHQCCLPSLRTKKLIKAVVHLQQVAPIHSRKNSAAF